MADTLHHDAFRGASKLLEARVTILALGPTEFHLDEFVVIERTTGLGDHRRGDPVLAYHDDRVERVPQAAKVLTLAF